ncbi:MAG: cyclic nucleotide-binding domain-containing protein [Brevefilum sp.]
MVDIKTYIQIISRVPLFSGLSEKQLKKLANRLTRRDYDEGENIITQGKGGEGLFVISEGEAEAVRIQPDGEKITVNTFGPNDFFGELALLDEGLRTASVTAKSEVSCLILTRWDFKGILKNEPEMAVTMLEELAKRFRRALETL